MKRLMCLILGHKYALVYKLNRRCDLVACTRCLRRWGMNHEVRCLIPWDAELEEHHRFMGDLP